MAVAVLFSALALANQRAALAAISGAELCSNFS